EDVRRAALAGSGPGGRRRSGLRRGGVELMHELALTCEIVDLVAAAARGERVECVRLQVGALSCVEAEAVRFCFDVVARGTPAAGARLEIEQPAAEGRCPRCQSATLVVELPAVCAACDEVLILHGGTGVQISEIEVS